MASNTDHRSENPGNTGDGRRMEPELNDLRGQVKDIRAQLVHSEKMAVLGALTAGVAHELNNPIGFVKNNIVMLEEYLKLLLPALRALPVQADDGGGNAPSGRSPVIGDGEDLAEILDDIEPLIRDTREGTERLEDLVAGLRRFARADTPEGEPLNLNQCVTDTLKVAWNELKYRAEVIQDLNDIPIILGKPGEINQVILNLLINAAQAITGFGEIRVATQTLDDQVVLSVRDNGCGIAPELMERLFTPFFTTKPSGLGTGLGLSISHDIITAHGGRLEVDSTPGIGSEFRIYLPIHHEEKP